MRHDLLLESLLLINGIRQLAEGIRKLPPTDKELEPLGILVGVDPMRLGEGTESQGEVGDKGGLDEAERVARVAQPAIRRVVTIDMLRVAPGRRL